MKKVVAVLPIVLTVCLGLIGPVYATEHDIIVTTNASDGDISPLVFSHNIRWVDDGEFLWDTTNRCVNSAALSVLQQAARKPATLRFPGGHWGDKVRWRRAVGPTNKRPLQTFYAGSKTQNFGTDEVVAFAEEVSPGSKPLMQANWWLYNNPQSPQYSPDNGKREAAHWVEYANGVVTQDILDEAQDFQDQRTWEPSKFLDAQGEESQDPTATESADGVHSWLATEEAPKGYFAWLRRYFAWKRAGSPQVNGVDTWKNLNLFLESSYGAPYGIQYWEVGNEIAGACSAESYRDGVKAYSEGMKKANDEDGDITYGDYTIEEDDPYNGLKIKVGACMNDDAMLHTIASPVTAWDTTVLSSNSYKHIDFIACHPYTNPYPDEHYSRVLWEVTDSPPGVADAFDINLEAETTYTFRVRAKAIVPSEANDPEEFPQISAKLLGSGHPDISLTTSGSDNRRIDAYKYRVRNPASANGGGAQGFTSVLYDENKQPDGRNDYEFSVTITTETAGTYIPRVKMELDPYGQNSRIYISFLSYDDRSSETLLEFRDAEDQTRAVYAAPIIIGNHLAELKEHAASFTGKTIEVACTEYRALFGWSQKDADRNLKGTIVAADTIKEMIENGISLANFWEENAEIAEPESYGYHVVNGAWHGFDDKWYDTVPNADDYLAPGPNRVFDLLGSHFGTDRLPTTLSNVGLTSQHFHSPEYGWIAEFAEDNDDVPYLSAVASGAQWYGNRYSKIYILVINKDWAESPRSWTIQLNGLGAQPKKLEYYTLKCSGTGCGLEAVNTYESPDLISVAGPTDGLAEFDAQTSVIDHDFDPSSVTMVELTLPASVQNIGDLAEIPNGWSVNIEDKQVTAVFADRFYIEEPNRTSGIAVLKANSGLSVGQVVDVWGTLSTYDSERTIASPSVGQPTSGTPLNPLGMRNQWLGGESPSTSVPTPKDCFGFYNVGLLVQTWGRVSYVNTTDDYFYIDDGSGLEDGSQHMGVRVNFDPEAWVDPDDDVAVGQYRMAKGISGVRTEQSQCVRVLKPRSISDISDPITEWASKKVEFDDAGERLVTVWGIPMYPGPEAVFARDIGDQGCNAIALVDHLWRYDAPSQTWITYTDCDADIFGNCLVGEGYLLDAPDGSCHKYQCADVTGDQLISLPWGSDPAGDFSLIGNPFDTAKTWANFKVTDGVTLLTLTDAISQGWIDHIDGVTLPFGSQTMTSGVGYKIYPKRDNLALIIPE